VGGMDYLPCLGNPYALQELPSICKKKEHQLSPFPPSNRRALSQPPGEKGRGCSRCKQWGKDREAGRIWGCGRPTDLLTTQTPRRKHAAQSKAANRVGTRGGLCGLAAAIIALRPPRMPRLVRMGRGGKGKSAPLPAAAARLQCLLPANAVPGAAWTRSTTYTPCLNKLSGSEICSAWHKVNKYQELLGES
jgi:hypothetical protein